MSQRKSQRRVTLGLIQMSATEDAKANLDKAVTGISAAAKKGAQIVCLQELFRSRYFPQSEDTEKFKLAEAIPGPTTETLSRFAKKKKIAIISSIFERRSAGIYHNTAVIIGADGSILGKYRKMHIPDDPCYYEKFYFTPGDLGFLSFDVEVARIGVLICWDQWFPEAARLTSLSGAEILFYPTAIGWLSNEPVNVAKAQQSAWELVQRGHAVANGVYVAVANRVGRERKLTFWGNSFVANPFGEIIAHAGTDREEILIARCDLGKIAQARESWPFLRDRRIDAYSALSARFLDEGSPVKSAAVSSLENLSVKE
ncbi:MAG: carbon-nitrogen hydrolase [Deltaproteobacteria bacterium]|nr:MAG: carbon-nitrogen hydrolase [Deltaproteobacteria bacterium]